MFADSDWNSSYVLGNDTVNGWGTRYFYTFYTEFGERHGAVGVEVSVLSTTFVASVIANLTIAVAVLRYREMRTVTNCFLLNLAVADFLFALGIPAVVTARIHQRWQLGDYVCRLLPYSQFVCGFVLLWTLTLISMDRHRCIVVPPYKSQLTPRLAAIHTAATWFLASVLFLPVAFWFREVPELGICTLVFPRSDVVNVSVCFTVPVLFFSCLLPMALLVYHYQRIFSKLLQTRKRWTTYAPNDRNAMEVNRKAAEFRGSRKISLQQMVYPTRHSSLSRHEEIRFNKHVRVVRVLLLNVLVVLNMWLPITVVMFLIYLDGSRQTDDTNFFLRSHHFIWALAIALLNTVVNPILYGVLSENFRACFSRLWLGSRKRRRTISKDVLSDEVSRDRPEGSKDGSKCSRNHEPHDNSVMIAHERRARLCYHTSCSNPGINTSGRTFSCIRHHRSLPGSAVSITDLQSTTVVQKL